MSEKLDGVRCYWNGSNLYKRGGGKFNPPKWFTDELPADMALDGELFTKRDDFQRISKITSKQDDSRHDLWREITYMAYDAPLEKGNFAKRLELAEKRLATCNEKMVKYHTHVKCKS